MALTNQSIAAWNPNHLEQSAAWIDTQQQAWTEHFSHMLQQVEGLRDSGQWVGLGGNEAALIAFQDHVTALTLSTPAIEATATLSAAAGDLTAGQHTILDLIAVAQDTPPPVGGFKVTVNDGVTVEDVAFKNYPDKTIQQARKAQAQAHAMDITSAITSWQTHKQAVAAALRTHAETLQSTGGASMLDNHFKTGGGDDPFNDPPIPPIGDQPIIGSAGTTPLERDAERDLGSKLPPMPEPVSAPPAAAKCSPKELAQDTLDNVFATAGETAGIALLPTEGPAAVAGAIGLMAGAHAVEKTSETLIDCLERGIG